MPHFVYGLINPRTKAIRYVGVTDNVEERLRRHASLGRSSSPRDIAGWFRWHDVNGLKPVVTVLETFSTLGEASAAERRWISQLRECGAELLNVAPGGGLGVRRCSRCREPGHYVQSCPLRSRGLHV